MHLVGPKKYLLNKCRHYWIKENKLALTYLISNSYFPVLVIVSSSKAQALNFLWSIVPLLVPSLSASWNDFTCICICRNLTSPLYSLAFFPVKSFPNSQMNMTSNSSKVQLYFVPVQLHKTDKLTSVLPSHSVFKVVYFTRFVHMFYLSYKSI